MKSVPIPDTRADCARFSSGPIRSHLCLLLAISLGCPNLTHSLLAQEEKPVRPPSLRVEIVKGQSAVNNIKAHKAVEPVVLVRDEQGQPVSGVMVMFTLPETGPSGVLADGSKRAIVYADSEGKATMRGLTPNTTPGKFQIIVNTSFHGLTASASIEQTNVRAEEGKGSSRLIAILAIAGGAAAAGVLAASAGGSSGSTLTPTPGSPGRTATTITPGTPVFGAPQQ